MSLTPEQIDEAVMLLQEISGRLWQESVGGPVSGSPEYLQAKSIKLGQVSTLLTTLQAELREAGEALDYFVSWFEGDYMVDGVVVDNPPKYLQQSAQICEQALARIRQIVPGGER